VNLVSAGLMMALVLSACRTEGPPRRFTRDPSPSSTPTPTTGGAEGCSQDANVTVLGRANIFGAGIDELPAPGGGGGGVPPPCVAIPAGASMATVPRADGTLSFTPLRAPDTHFHKCPGGREAVLAFGPDGDAGVCGDPSYGAIEGAGIVSGITSKDRGGYLIGVFLPAHGKKGAPPPSLDFERNYNFARIAPSLGQLFFIGDGRTVDERLQRFDIPRGATRLYLGIADAWGFRGPPGFYDENYGRFRVEIRFE
jgi:hypothetical protein